VASLSDRPDRVHLLGVPFNSAGRADGVAQGPAALRQAGLLERLRGTGANAHDRGDVELPAPISKRDAASHVIGPGAMASMVKAVGARVAESLGQGAFPLVLGGDCPILLGCLAAGMQTGSSIGLLFVDGHEDAWPPEHSPSGEAADMELGFILGLHRNRLPASVSESLPQLDFDAVAVLGPRDQRELREAGISSLEGQLAIYHSAEAVAADPGALVADAAKWLARAGSWWLHVDLDVLSTESLAAVDYRQPGGLNWAALSSLTAAALRSPGIIGWDITIYNPNLDDGGTGATRIVRYVGDAFDGL
jgi:arginase